MELIARVEAILRRVRPPETASAESTLPDPVVFGRVTVHLGSRTVERMDRPVDLTPREFDLLVHLLAARGAAVPRKLLLREVWGYKRPVPTRTIDTHVANLRAKLEGDPAHPVHILTVRKVGYRIRWGPPEAPPHRETVR
jgi:DNA-binding response OmpR family regulator